MKINFWERFVFVSMLLSWFAPLTLAQENTAVSQSPAVYENKEAGFKITCPAGWHTREKVYKEEQTLEVIFSLLPYEPIVKENVSLRIAVHPEPKSFNVLQPFNGKQFGGMLGLMYYSQDALKKQQGMKDVEITVIQEPVSIEVNGANGVWCAFERFSPRSPLKRVVKMAEYEFINRGKWITIMCTAGKDEYLAQEKEITAAIKSLNFN